MSLYIAAFIFPSIMTSLPVPAAEKHPHSMTLLPPPSFTIGLVLAWYVVTSKHDTWHSHQGVQSLSHQTKIGSYLAFDVKQSLHQQNSVCYSSRGKNLNFTLISIFLCVSD
ncbi:hypothetical protein GOODEAATRI_024928 [Goodea atripinnis]|uniref:Uncharacterized protein n=1 Tax=Goodea atripinnis TaxID=208336 RepID=A0ABV0NXK3_9TELE